MRIALTWNGCDIRCTPRTSWCEKLTHTCAHSWYCLNQAPGQGRLLRRVVCRRTDCPGLAGANVSVAERYALAITLHIACTRLLPAQVIDHIPECRAPLVITRRASELFTAVSVPSGLGTDQDRGASCSACSITLLHLNAGQQQQRCKLGPLNGQPMALL